jgi:4-hydroxy-3-methylbut-2-enyl diphosphate reductase
MILRISKYTGFCFGVSRAVNVVIKNSDRKIKVLGQIVHNEILINKLRKNKNIIFIDNCNEVQNGETVITRSHGEKLEVINNFKMRNVNVIDMTCPKVRIFQEIANKTKFECKRFIIIGNAAHPEVIAAASRCSPEVIINDLNGAKIFTESVKLKLKNEKFTVAVQTTYNAAKYREICKFLSKNFPSMEFKNTICGDALNRQEEVEKKALISDLAIVIGSKTSSNSDKLYKIARDICDSFLINNINDFDFNILKEKKNIFVCSGASAMKQTAEQFCKAVKKYCDSKNIDLVIK